MSLVSVSLCCAGPQVHTAAVLGRQCQCLHVVLALKFILLLCCVASVNVNMLCWPSSSYCCCVVSPVSMLTCCAGPQVHTAAVLLSPVSMLTCCAGPQVHTAAVLCRQCQC